MKDNVDIGIFVSSAWKEYMVYSWLMLYNNLLIETGKRFSFKVMFDDISFCVESGFCPLEIESWLIVVISVRDSESASVLLSLDVTNICYIL